MLAHRKSGHILGVIGIIIFSLYALLLWPGSSSAGAVGYVGTLAVELYPNAPVQADGTNFDQVSLKYDGNNNAGQFDLSGWTIGNGSGFSYSFPAGTVIPSGSERVLCSGNSALSQCTDLIWVTDVWDDVGGTLSLSDADGQVVFTLPYAGLTTDSRPVRDVYERYVTVFDANDKIQLCHTADGLSYKLNKANAAHIINLKGSHKDDVNDIIPSFFYNFGGGLGYFMGQNWNPANAGLLEMGCAG